MATESERVSGLVQDYAAIQKELARLISNDPLLYQLNHCATDQDWDQTRALKTAVVLLAARVEDLYRALELSEQLRPVAIVIEPQPSPAR